MNQIAVVLLLALGMSVRAGAQGQDSGRVPVPDVSAPVTAGARRQAFGALTPKDLPSGFIEEERFVSGVARSYTKAGT